MQQKNLVNKNDINGELTCITLSKTPFIRNDIGSSKYINYNSIFENEKDHFIATRNALRLCDTQYCIICDDDDPFPDNVIYPDKSLVYGDFLLSSGYEFIFTKSHKWSFNGNLNRYWLIHKPIIRTDLALSILDTVEPTDIHFHYFLYFMMSYCFGSEYDNRLEIWWNKNEQGLHNYASKLKHKTQSWLTKNAENIKRAILQ